MDQNFTIIHDPVYMKVYSFEKYDSNNWRLWWTKNRTFVVYASALYVSLIYFGQKWMESRKPIILKQSLLVWNFSLAVLSFVTFFRMIPEVLVEYTKEGLFSSFCFLKNHNVATGFWGVLFCLSKVLDFGDTFFLIFAKKPVIFLHWYHHVTVAIYCVMVAADTLDPSTRWFAGINSLVHGIMYTYYGITTMGIKLPKLVSISITSLQISQMAFGIYINTITYFYKAMGTTCNREVWKIEAALIMYTSYLILFVHFFYKSYISTNVRRKVKQN